MSAENLLAGKKIGAHTPCGHLAQGGKLDPSRDTVSVLARLADFLSAIPTSLYLKHFLESTPPDKSVLNRRGASLRLIQSLVVPIPF